MSTNWGLKTLKLTKNKLHECEFREIKIQMSKNKGMAIGVLGDVNFKMKIICICI